MIQTDLPLQGRVAIVTGATSGIGAAIAEHLVQAGARVALVGRRADRLAELTARLGSAALAVTADLADAGAATEVTRQTVAAFGQVDILVNNAGLMIVAPFAEDRPEDWERALDVNLLAMFRSTQAALPHLRGQRGHVVNVASLAGHTPFANFAVYTATKFGVVGYSEALRQELRADGVRVTVISPGVVATDLWGHSSHQGGHAYAQGFLNSIQAPLTADDVAQAVLFAVTRSPHVNVNEILLQPTEQ